MSKIQWKYSEGCGRTAPSLTRIKSSKPFPSFKIFINLPRFQIKRRKSRPIKKCLTRKALRLNWGYKRATQSVSFGTHFLYCGPVGLPHFLLLCFWGRSVFSILLHYYNIFFIKNQMPLFNLIICLLGGHFYLNLQ